MSFESAYDDENEENARDAMMRFVGDFSFRSFGLFFFGFGTSFVVRCSSCWAVGAWAWTSVARLHLFGGWCV